MPRAVGRIDSVHDVPPQQAVQPIAVSRPVTPIRMIRRHDGRQNVGRGNRKTSFTEASLNVRKHFEFDRSHIDARRHGQTETLSPK